MANYKFRLQKILDYKETLENLKKSEYGIAVQKLQEEEKILFDLNKYKNNLLIDMRDNKKTIRIGTLKEYNTYISEISKKIEKQKEIVDIASEKMNQAQKNLLEAMQEKKAFEKLKEKEYEKYLLEERRKEDKLIDQIVTFKIGRQ